MYLKPCMFDWKYHDFTDWYVSPRHDVVEVVEDVWEGPARSCIVLILILLKYFVHFLVMHLLLYTS